MSIAIGNRCAASAADLILEPETIMDMLLPKKNNCTTMINRPALLIILLCLLLFAGCGKTAPDQPLTTDSGTPTVDTSVTGTALQIAPIAVVHGQTNLTAYPGGSMTLAISTSPFALSAIEVNYGLMSPSKSLGMAPLTADANGIASWHWTVTLNAHTGTWPLTISAILPNGSRTTAQVNVYVTSAPISVQSSVLSVYPGKQMSLTIATAPFANCSIQYAFESGRPTRTLTQKADGSGIASWNWTVGKVASAGTYQVTIIAALSDGEASYAAVNATVL